MTSSLPDLLKMRLLVAFLGERNQFGWWPTTFYDASSRQFLEPVFSKTTTLAQYHGVLEAARRLHDDHLSVGSFHLFRLPEELEQDLHKMLQGTAAEETTQVPRSTNAALDALTRIATGDSKFSEGPVAVGSIADVDSSRTLGAIASAYAWAFSRDVKTYPYLIG